MAAVYILMGVVTTFLGSRDERATREVHLFQSAPFAFQEFLERSRTLHITETKNWNSVEKPSGSNCAPMRSDLGIRKADGRDNETEPEASIS